MQSPIYANTAAELHTAQSFFEADGPDRFTGQTHTVKMARLHKSSTYGSDLSNSEYFRCIAKVKAINKHLTARAVGKLFPQNIEYGVEVYLNSKGLVCETMNTGLLSH